VPASTLHGEVKPGLPCFGYRVAIVDREAGENGYFFILGRTDDIINVSGHRIGTMEIEETIYSDSDIADSAAIGVRDEIKGLVKA